jgi:opacity protein-like surface antigen
VLVYGTAGLAWERFEQIEFAQRTRTAGTTSSNILTMPADHFGWVAGVGAEMMLGANWIGRLEYLHYDFGRVVSDSGSTQSPPLLTVASSTGRQTIDLLRAGVSYKFGPDLPIATAGEVRYAKAPVTAPPSSRWAGLYAGAHSGYGWLDSNLSNVEVPSGIKAKGWLGGGHFGYLWQYASAVAGLEIDGTATGISGTAAPGKSALVFPGETDTVIRSQKIDYLGTVRSRLGWTPAGNWLLYGTGGLAWERAHRRIDQTSVFSSGVVGHGTSEAPSDSFGWVAGAGAETFIGSSSWIARLEYLHYDFGNVDGLVNRVSTIPTTPTTSSTGGRQTIDIVRAGVSYKFTP